MTAFGDYPELDIDIDNFIATVEIQRPPFNFFHVGLINALADAFEDLDHEPSCRAIVLCSAGKAFCAGADVGGLEKISAKGEYDAGISEDEEIARMVSSIPLGRLVAPEDLANAVLFFCTPLASMITGQCIAVDGGSGESINY